MPTLPKMILAAALLLPAPLAAKSFFPFDRLTVVPLSGGDFEVIEKRGAGARGLWCAAADYVLRTGRASNEDQLYVKRARGTSVSGAGRFGVTFTTNPQGLQPRRSVSVSVRQPGLTLPAGHAVQFCRDLIIEPDDLKP